MIKFIKSLICKIFKIKECNCPKTIIDRIEEDINHCVVNDCTHDWGGR